MVISWIAKQRSVYVLSTFNLSLNGQQLRVIISKSGSCRLRTLSSSFLTRTVSLNMGYHIMTNPGILRLFNKTSMSFTAHSSPAL